MVNETSSEEYSNIAESAAIEGEAVQDAQAAPSEAGGTTPAVEASDEVPSSAAAGASEATAAEPVAAPKAPSWAEMTPEERFRATTKLIFIAPDVPPIQPRPRRSELGRLDDIFDQQFERHTPRDEAPEERESYSSRRRRQRTAEPAQEEEAPRRPVRQAPVISEPQKVKGSTRLEAKKQRRRDGRDIGRRRNVITESEFLARREAVDREMIVRTTADRVQIGVLEDRVLVEHYVARSSENSLIGNVYLGRVQNVLPSMEAAFVDIGRGRNAVLYSGEVDWSEFEGSNSARRIENALKPGDQVLVQVTKDPVGHKGARLTSQISLPGRFLVYVPGGAMNGISRKLPDTERARLKKILKEVLPSGAGVIVRTAAEGATEEQLTHDVERLARQWESIQQRTAKGGGPVLLHSEPDMLIKIIRDVFNEDFQRLVIAGEDTYRVIEDYLTQVAPDLMQRVERYEGERDIFSEFRVTEQIAKALDRKVWLPSGGSLVIDRTEAMTVVDVNTGKFVGSGGNLEETVTKNNLESAEEIVRQLRLRDIGGIIVIDFIDMVLESNRDLVLRRLVECLSRDRTKHQVAEVTSLGLVQMTRKKLGLGLLESFSDPCDVCAGRGIIVHHEPVSKHRGESPARNSRRNKNSQSNHGSNQSSSHSSHQGGNQGQGQQQGQSQQHGAQSGSAGHAHAITDGAKNMLAQVAASTIAGSKSEEDSAAASVSGANGSQVKAASTKSGIVKTGVVKSGSARAAGAGQSVAAEAPANDLLTSLLDALPEPPAAGAGRTRGRRVSSSPVRTPALADRVSSDAPASDAAEEAKRALAEALAETSRRADEARE